MGVSIWYHSNYQKLISCNLQCFLATTFLSGNLSKAQQFCDWCLSMLIKVYYYPNQHIFVDSLWLRHWNSTSKVGQCSSIMKDKCRLKRQHWFHLDNSTSIRQVLRVLFDVVLMSNRLLSSLLNLKLVLASSW